MSSRPLVPGVFDELLAPHPEDHVVRLEPGSRVAVRLGKEWSEDFVTLNGVPLPFVRDVCIYNTCRAEQDTHAGYRTYVVIRCLQQQGRGQMRPRSDFSDAVHEVVDASAAGLDTLRGVLVSEEEWDAFHRWKRDRAQS